jgi:hypothetical protein
MKNTVLMVMIAALAACNPSSNEGGAGGSPSDAPIPNEN